MCLVCGDAKLHMLVRMKDKLAVANNQHFLVLNEDMHASDDL